METKEEKKMYPCEKCGRSFDRKANLTRHLRVHELRVTNVICKICFKSYANEPNLKQHLDSIHGVKTMDKPKSIIVPNKS